jgi:hypothetical protein
VSKVLARGSSQFAGHRKRWMNPAETVDHLI